MRRLLVGALLGSVMLLLTSAVSVMASELTGGCALEVRSFDGPNATGSEVDEGQLAGISAEGDVGTQSRPFKVDPKGSVDFVFSTGTTVFVENDWSIQAQGLPINLLAGSDDNPLDLDERGVVNLGEQLEKLPIEVSGVFYITGDLVGNNGASRCHGEGYVQVLGNPLATPLGLLAAALIALGAAALLVATPYSADWEVDPTSGERLRSGPLDRI
jgi:hypothetical protein